MYLRARNYGISYLPQEPSIFRKLTVEDNILAVLEAQPISWHERRERMEKLIDQLGLGVIRKNRGYALVGRRTAAESRSRAACVFRRRSFCWTNPFPESIPSRYWICKRSSSI